MTKMLTLTSPQHILCQFPNKFALFPQQNCFISPTTWVISSTHFLISPATLCHFAPHQKTMIFFGNFIWGFISQHHWITLTKAKTFRGFKSHRCFKLVIQNEDLELPSWHMRDNMVEKRVNKFGQCPPFFFEQCPKENGFCYKRCSLRGNAFPAGQLDNFSLLRAMYGRD